jgi:hypothetical protein
MSAGVYGPAARPRVALARTIRDVLGEASMRRTIILLVTLAMALATTTVAIATSFTDKQANEPQVAGQPASDTTARFPTNKQNEPSIAVDPTNLSNLIAGSNDEQLQPPCGPGPVRGASAPANDCSFFPNVGTSGVYTSSDGGGSWTNRGLLPGYSDNGGSLVSDGDPAIVFGPKPTTKGSFSFANGARAYYANLSSFASGAANGNQIPELIAVSRSDNDGVSWKDPVVAASGNGFKFNDKVDIWADKNPASSFFGRVYVTWTQFRGSLITFFAEPVMVTFSDDGGNTWSTPNQLSVAHNNRQLGGRQGSAVRTGPDGTVYAFWEDSGQTGSIMVVASSSDGGVHWTHATTIANVRDIADPIPGANFRTDSFVSAAVDQSSGALYAAWSDATGGQGHIVIAKSTDKGGTWSGTKTVSAAANGYAFFQGLDVAPSGRVDVAYQAQISVSTTTYGTGNAKIDSYYTSSTDGGATFSAPTKVTSASSDPAASAQNNLARQFWGDYNTLVSTNAFAYFIYTDSRSGVGCAAVDAYQHGVDGSGPAVAKPAPENSCASQFGNSDVFVSKITP